MSMGRPQMPELIGAALGAGPGLYKGVSDGFDGDALGTLGLGMAGGGAAGGAFRGMRDGLFGGGGGILGDGSPQGRPTGDRSRPFSMYGG